MTARSRHTIGDVKRASDGVFVITCAAGDFSYASPSAEHVADVELRKDTVYQAMAEHCIDAWRKEGRL